MITVKCEIIKLCALSFPGISCESNISWPKASIDPCDLRPIDSINHRVALLMAKGHHNCL